MSAITINHLSHSQVTTFTTCPRRWHYEKVEQAPRERTSAALAFGVAIHEAVAAINEAAMHEVKHEAREVFIRRWRTAVDDAGAPVEFGKDDAGDLLAKGIALIGTYQPPTGIFGVEQPFEVELAPDLPPVQGRIDVIRREETGDLVLADVKTCASRSLSETHSVEAQLALYDVAYPAQRHEAIVLGKLKTPTLMTQPITPCRRDRLVEHYREVHAAMTGGARFAVRGWHCGSCPFRDRCRRG